MKSTSLGLAAILAVGIFSNSHAQAQGHRSPSGGEGGGGGSVFMPEGRLVESVGGKNPHDLPGFDEGLAWFAARVPDYARALEALFAKKNVYFVPRKPRQIPAEISGLYFETENPCYQPNRDELFCHVPSLLAIRARRDGARSLTDFWKHELLVGVYWAGWGGRVSFQNVRRATTVLVSEPDAAYPTVAKALAENSLATGHDLTPAEVLAAERLPQNAATLPTWANAMVRLCHYAGTNLSVSDRFSAARNEGRLQFTHSVPHGSGVALFNGYLYGTGFDPLPGASMEEGMFSRRLYVLSMSRKTSAGQRDSLVFICRFSH